MYLQIINIFIILLCSYRRGTQFLIYMRKSNSVLIYTLTGSLLCTSRAPPTHISRSRCNRDDCKFTCSEMVDKSMQNKFGELKILR